LLVILALGALLHAAMGRLEQGSPD
jgi:hypothetical protein